MAGHKNRIEGEPYSATFIPTGYINDMCPVANVVVEPPFSFNSSSFLISLALEGDFEGRVTMAHGLSTMTKTLVEVYASSDTNFDITDQDRLDVAYAGAASVISLLNRVETGNF